MTLPVIDFQKELARLRVIQASHRVDARFGNKAARPALKAVTEQIKKLELELKQQEGGK